MLDFNCDRKAKCDWTASTAAYLDAHWAGDYVYYESDRDGNLVPFGSDDAWEKSRMDLYLTLYSAYTPVVTYAVELKERWGYPSTTYGGEDQEGWMYNIPKDEWFKTEIMAGRIPLFSNLYPDGKITIWNIKRISPENISHMRKWIKGINIDPNSHKTEQKRLGLMNKDGLTIDRIDGNQ